MISKKLTNKLKTLYNKLDDLEKKENEILNKIYQERKKLEDEKTKVQNLIAEQQKKDNKIFIQNKWQQVVKDCLKNVWYHHGIGQLATAMYEVYSNSYDLLKTSYPEILDKFLKIDSWYTLEEFFSFCQSYRFKETMSGAAECGESYNLPEYWFIVRSQFNENWYNHPIVKKEYEREDKELNDNLDYDDDWEDD